MRLEIGDKLRVAGTCGLAHFGVYVGPEGPGGEDVVHNRKDGGVELLHLSEFSGGRRAEVDSRVARSWDDCEAIKERALSLLGQRYQLLDFNCEHAANYAQTGKVFSPAVSGLIVLGIVGAIAWAASRA